MQEFYKIFHLVNDSSSTDVPEKVFLVEEELKRLQRRLNGRINVEGLVGPSHMMIEYLNNELKQKDLDEHTPLTEAKLNLEEKEVGAVFAFILMSEPIFMSENEETKENDKEESGHKKDLKNKVFLLFVTNDEFFYQKPIPENSIRYLLIRFIGDLCPDIKILYDQKIEDDFVQEGCPYSSSKKNIATLRIVKRTEEDIKTEEINCDFSKLFEFDNYFSQKVHFKSSIHCNKILHNNQSLEADFEREAELKLSQKQSKLWEIIFKNQESDVRRILFVLEEEEKEANKNVIKRIIEVKKDLKEKVKKLSAYFASECLLKLQKKKALYYSTEFYENIYHQLIVSSIDLIVKSKKWSFREDVESICKRIAGDIYHEQKYFSNLNHNSGYNYYIKIFVPLINDLFNKENVIKEISIRIDQFYNISKELLVIKKINKQHAFKLTYFNLKFMEKEKIELESPQHIFLEQAQFEKDLGKEFTFESVESIQLFDLKNTRNSKLICIKLKSIENRTQNYSLAFFSYSNNQLKNIGSYKAKGLLFNFHSETQKLFIINPTEWRVSSMRIDSLERFTENSEKIIRNEKGRFEPIDFGISINPSEVLFYIDKEMKCLYEFNISTSEYRTLDRSKTGPKYLIDPEQGAYEYLRVFNENTYIALGNSKKIDIFYLKGDGKLEIKKEIKLDLTFLGAIVVSKDLNEYLIAVDSNASNSSKAITFLNMNCNTKLEKGHSEKNKNLGNPILDIFYGAKHKFGDYKKFNNKSKRSEIQSLNLLHMTQSEILKKKIKVYLEELRLQGHEHHYFEENEKIIKFSSDWIESKEFFDEIQTRIPIQLCTLENSNIVPLIGGKEQNQEFFSKLTIADRCKIIEFGIVEDLLLSEPNKRVIVISIMGAQSTGKSYLMNLLFGTRFTVSSSRTTIGIWLSIIRTANVNYLLMDCEGLFSDRREEKEEEKLIRVLASISDYTILNQNMSLNSRNIMQLMQKIADTIKTSAKNNNRLYKGELFIIVRDVKSSDASGITKEFEENLKQYQKKDFKYIENLFGGKINFFPIEHFENKEFHDDLGSIRSHIEKEGLKRPLRTCQQISDSLKVIVNQLSCDDSRNFDEEMHKYRIEKSKQVILEVWKNGEDENFSQLIREINFCINQKSLEITEEEFKKESSFALSFIENQFQEKVINNERLKTTEYVKIYEEYNNFIKEFFQKRFESVERKIKYELETSLKDCPISEKEGELNSLKLAIYNHKRKFALCMEKCHAKGCHLICTSKFQHKFNIESEKETIRVRRDGLQKTMQAKQLSEEEINEEKKRLEVIINKLKEQLEEHNRIKDLICNLYEKHREKTQLFEEREIKKSDIETEKKKIDENKLKAQELLKIIQGIRSINEDFDKENKEDSLDKVIEFIESYISRESVDENSLKVFANEYKEKLINCFNKLEEKEKENEELKKKKENKKLSIELKIKEIQNNINNEQKQKESKENEKTKLEEKLTEFKSKKEETIKEISKLREQHDKIEEQLKTAKESLKVSNDKKFTNEIQIKKEEERQNRLCGEKEKVNKSACSPLFIEEAKTNYIIPQIIEFNKIKSSFESSVYEKNPQETQKEIDSLLSEMIERKILNQKENKTQALEDTKKRLKVINFKIEKNIDVENQKVEAEKINVYLKKLEELIAQEYAFKKLENFKTELEAFKSTFFAHELAEEWILIEKLIFLKLRANESDSEIKSQKHLLFESLQVYMKELASENQIELEKSEEQLLFIEKKEILMNKVEEIKEKGKKLLEEIDKTGSNEDTLMKEYENNDILEKKLNIIVEIRKKMEIFIMKRLQEEKFNKSEAAKMKTQIDDVFKSESDLKIKLDHHQNENEFFLILDGKIETNFSEFISKFVECFYLSRGNHQRLEINEKEFKSFEKLKISKEYFNYLKQTIESFSKCFGNNINKSEVKKKTAIILSSMFEKERDNENFEEKVLASLSEGLLEISLVPILNSIKTNMLKKLENIANEMNRVFEEIRKLKLKNEELIVLIVSEEETIKKLESKKIEIKTNEEEIKKNNKTNQEEIEKKDKLFDKLTKELEISQEKLNDLNQQKNKKLDELEEIKNELLIIQSNYIKFQEIKKKENLEKLNNCEKEFLQNKECCESIKKIEGDISEMTVKINNLEEEEKQMKEQASDKTIDMINEEINDTQEEIDKNNLLKAKVKHLKETKDDLLLLEKRLEDLENSSKYECKCLTDHLCGELCESKCENQKCEQGAGHEGSHLCKFSDHKCTEKCSFNDDCETQCNEVYAHSIDIPHHCGKSHQCESLCNFCNKKCSKNLFDRHDEHLCEKNDGCEKKCLLCNEKCDSKDHDHDNEAEEVQIEEIDKETGEKHIVHRKLHLCSKEHECRNLCNDDGICSYKYQNIKKKWVKKDHLEREYIYTQQIEIKNTCVKKIPVGQIRHKEGECRCREAHTCNIRCPDCGSLCQFEKNHKGKHKTEHRNQEELLYASTTEQKEFSVVNTNESYIFSVGDISLPTRCHGSCDAKGRGHYHLIECKGGSDCYEKKLEIGAVHSTKQYYPYPEKTYDMVLCKIYWELFNFEMPSNQEEFEKCNFVCPMNHEKQKQTFFCTQLAWHSFSDQCQDHTFECSDQHKASNFNKMEICFLIDISGSMQKFIDESQKVIEQIIKKATKTDVEIKFSLVGYRDHEMYKSKITIKLKELCIEKKNKLKSLTSTPFKNQKMTEKEFVLKLLKIEKKFEINKKSENIRNCFDENELFILDYCYPFLLDIASGEDLVGPIKKIELLNPLIMMIKLLGGDVDESKSEIKTLILNNIDENLAHMNTEESLEKTMLKETALLEIVDFDNAAVILQKLKTLEASGGGDPPEAVLDGMDEVCNLKWTSDITTLRYLFHIFDAPPHGREYAQDNGDRFPDGCPCGKTHEPIIEKLNKIPNLNYVMYPLTERVNTTLDLFEEAGLKFEKNSISKDSPQDFAVHATDFICRNLEQEQIMISKE